MREPEAFRFIGNLDSIGTLVSKVSKLADPDWLEYLDRKNTGGTASAYSDTIPLIYNPEQDIKLITHHKNYEEYAPFIDETVSVVAEKLSLSSVKQAIFARLRAHSEIKPHKDSVGSIVKKTHRIHLPVITNEKCSFTVSKESKNLKVGEIWIIDNVHKVHSVNNLGDTDRVHLIIDAI